MGSCEKGTGQKEMKGSGVALVLALLVASAVAHWEVTRPRRQAHFKSAAQGELHDARELGIDYDLELQVSDPVSELEQVPPTSHNDSPDPEMTGAALGHMRKELKTDAINGGAPLNAFPEQGLNEAHNRLIAPGEEVTDGAVHDGILTKEREAPKFDNPAHLIKDPEDQLLQTASSPYELADTSRPYGALPGDRIEVINHALGNIGRSFEGDRLFPGGRRVHSFDPTIPDTHHTGEVDDSVADPHDADPKTHEGRI